MILHTVAGSPNGRKVEAVIFHLGLERAGVAAPAPQCDGRALTVLIPDLIPVTKPPTSAGQTPALRTARTCDAFAPQA